MARYRVTGPDGVSVFEVEAPDNASEAEIVDYVKKNSQQQQQPNVSTMEALGRGALQGATFGLSDEIYAGAKGAYNAVTGGGSFGDTYNKELTDVRAANERARTSAPLAYIGGEVAGGLALPAGAIGSGARLAKTAADATRTGRALAGAATGAAYGGAYGFGTADGGDGSLLQQAGSRALSALPSAIGGAVIGAAAPAVVDLASSAIKGVTNPIRAAVNPSRTASTKVAEALLRDAPPGTAIDDVVGRAGRRLAGAQATKPDAMLADVGGQNTRDLLRSAANMPSQGAERLRSTLDRRQGFQWSRIEKDLAATLADGNKFASTLDTWTTIINNTGKVVFEKAYAQPFNVKAGDDLARFITERGYVRRLLEKADDSIQGMTGESPAQMSPWELLHRVKMEMDREITRLKSGQGDAKANWTLRDLTSLKREMVDLMGKANPQFRHAMERYGDVAGVRTALERGAEEFKAARPDEIVKALKGMTPPEQSMFRMGAARSIFEQVEKGNVTRDRTDGMFSSPEMQRKLAALFPSTAARRDFQRRLILEARMADTRKAVQGNSTTAKQLAQGAEAGQPVAAVNAVANATAGRFAPAMNYLSRQAQAFNGMTPAVSNEVIQELMQKSVGGTDIVLKQAIDRAAREPAFRDMLVRKLLAGSAAGRAANGDLNRPQQ